jgi:hypothetical protein
MTACKPIDLGAPPASPAPAPKPPPANAAALLKQLVVASEDTGAHYNRDEWGEDWADHGDGCSTRELVLLGQSRTAQRGRDCAPTCPEAAGACWVSPYDGRPTADPGELEIDHRVSLKEASRSRVVAAGGKPELGAARLWPADRKQAFYQDQANLVAVTAEVNQSKSDEDAGDWQPSVPRARCEFATRYAQVKIRYRLTVDPAEHAALTRMLGTCPK